MKSNHSKKRAYRAYVRPKKRFGQHFIKTRGVLEKIVHEAGIREQDTVLEIGPGLGDLTELIAQKAKAVVAVEVDRDLAAGLTERFQGSDSVRIVNRDILKWPLPEGLDELPAPRRIVGNLPYNIATPILMRFIDYPGRIESMTLMFQKEVAERLAAEVGEPDYGALTLMVTLDWDSHIAYRIPASAFHPRPKVDSALVSFSPLSEPRVDVGDRAVFKRLVKAAFGHRRKTLRNALKAVDDDDSPVSIPDLPETVGIDGKRRGETLTMDEFAALSRAAAAISSPERGSEAG